MKNTLKLVSLATTLVIVGCASPRQAVLPGDTARFNEKKVEKVENVVTYKFHYQLNGQTPVLRENVVVGRVESWEDSFGNKITVETAR